MYTGIYNFEINNEVVYVKVNRSVKEASVKKLLS